MKFTFEVLVEFPTEKLFAFHEIPDNLSLLLRGWPSFRMISNSGHVRVGAITRVEERMALIPVRMSFRHFLYEPPHRFGESLFQGPFLKYEHIHEFKPSDSGTFVRDLLDVRLPWYLGGELAMKLIVAPRIRRFFSYRHAELPRLFGVKTQPQRHKEHNEG